MTIISSVPVWPAARPAAMPIAKDGQRNANDLTAAAAHVDLTSAQRRISALAAAGPLYGAPAATTRAHAEDIPHSRQKRFAPVMLAADEINDISANAISKTLAAILDNTIDHESFANLSAADAFSRATITSAAMTGENVGRQAGMAMGELEGAQSGMREGLLAGVVHGAIAGSMSGGSHGALAGSLTSGGKLEGSIWGEMAGIAAGRSAGRSLGGAVGAEAGREAGARAGAIHGTKAGRSAGQKAGVLAGRAVAEHLLPRLLSANQRDDVMQIWRIAEEHGPAAAVTAREIAERAAHEVGKLAGERAGILAGRRMGYEIARRDGALAGAQAGGDAGYQAGIRAGNVIGRLARNPDSQVKIGQSIDALSLAKTKTATHSYQNIDTLLLTATKSTTRAPRNIDALLLAPAKTVTPKPSDSAA